VLVGGLEKPEDAKEDEYSKFKATNKTWRLRLDDLKNAKFEELESMNNARFGHSALYFEF
jgi:hypothetical protein